MAVTPPRPLPLTLALAVVALEVLAFGAYGVVELAAFDSKRPEVALTSGAFFLAYAGFLTFFGWRLSQLESWARAPIVMCQLLQIPVAINFWGGETRTNVVSIALLVVSVAVLGGIFHPRSLAALEDEPA